MKYIKVFEKFYTPPKSVKQKLDKIVSELLKKYERGPQFFEALDSKIKDISNEDMILYLVSGCKDKWVCSSGEFGQRLKSLLKDGKFKCKGFVTFSGKMTSRGKDVEWWEPENFDFNNKEFVYVDDSYFSGKTANKIDDFLSERNSKISEIYVVYDGSMHRKDNVHSFFRYYGDVVKF